MPFAREDHANRSDLEEFIDVVFVSGLEYRNRTNGARQNFYGCHAVPQFLVSERSFSLARAMRPS